MTTATFPLLRLRRLRQHRTLRDLVRETELNVKDLVMPLFIKDNAAGVLQPIESMPGMYQIPLSLVAREIEELMELGISSVILFGVPAHKDAYGSDSYSDEGIVQRAIGKIREVSKELLLISDLCFCEYTDHGHCGLLNDKLEIDNDKTLEFLVKQAMSHARAGAHVIAPSGMIDGMVKAIRTGLDEAGFDHIPILSYSAKYCSNLYGPFRVAAEGAAAFGDRSSHQMDCANAKEALREVELDIQEGADILMVKPAHAYLDVILRVKEAYPHIPLCAYHTSGEFSMIKAAAQRGWIDERKVALEILTAIRRAGADFVISYYAKEIARWLS